MAFLRVALLLLLLPLAAGGAVPAVDPAIALLDHLAGKWVMTGTLGSKQTIHDVASEWVLKREYLRLHEVSREKTTGGMPVYEALIFISWDAKAGEYVCLWLDNTAAGGLSAPRFHGKRSGNSIPLVFTYSPRESLHTTFRYDPATDTWRLTIDDVTAGKTARFGDVRLTRYK